MLEYINLYIYLSILGADETPGPVKWIRPYFDCGRSNTWKFAAVVPIVDIYPRHTQFRHIEYPSYVAASVMEIDFERVDINQVAILDIPCSTNIFSVFDLANYFNVIVSLLNCISVPERSWK